MHKCNYNNYTKCDNCKKNHTGPEMALESSYKTAVDAFGGQIIEKSEVAV